MEAGRSPGKHWDFWEPLFVFEDEPLACWVTAGEMDALNYACWMIREGKS